MLVALRASGFSAPPPAQAGDPSGGHRTIEITGDTGGAHDSARLEVWDDACPGDGGASGAAGGVHASGDGRGQSGARASGSASIASDLDRLWRQLEAANRRDPHLLVVDPTGVDGVELSEGEHRLRLHRNDDGGWHFVEPTVSYEADAKVVSDWLAKLAATTLAEDAPPPAHGGSSRASAPSGGRGRRARGDRDRAAPRRQARVDRPARPRPRWSAPRRSPRSIRSRCAFARARCWRCRSSTCARSRSAATRTVASA